MALSEGMQQMSTPVETPRQMPAGTPVVKRIRGCAPCEAARLAREAARAAQEATEKAAGTS